LFVTLEEVVLIRINTRIAVICCLALLVQGCASAPDERSRVAPSAAYARIMAAEAEYGGKYWEEFGDESLTALIAGALKDNPGLERTRQRLLQAEAVARRSGADLLPDVTVTGGRDTLRGDTSASSSFSLRGAASYELDLWGRNRAGYRAGLYDAAAAEEEIHAAAITLTAEIVQDWLRLAALREEEALLNRQIDINRDILELQQMRFDGGIATALDVLQQQEVLARSQAQLPDLRGGQELLQHRLAVLAGRSPSEPLPLDAAALPALLPLPDAGLPSDLLENRPDVEAAWLRVSSADWAKAAASADRLPRFNLSATYTTAGAAFSGLFNTWVLNLAAALVAPVFDGGERAAEEARQQAVADERFQTYRETVLNALKDVEDALSQNRHQNDKITAVEDQLAASRHALEQAQISYANGAVEYLSVLNALLNVQNLERQLVQERRDLALSRVALYRALGGRGWTDIALSSGESKWNKEDIKG